MKRSFYSTYNACGSLINIIYTYDMFGRFHSVSSSVQSAQSVVEYSRLANSDLLSGRSLEIGNSLLAVGYSYDHQGRMVWKKISRGGAELGD